MVTKFFTSRKTLAVGPNYYSFIIPLLCLVSGCNTSHPEIDKAKAIYSAAILCLKSRVLSKSEKDALEMLKNNEINKYDRFINENCTDQDRKMVVNTLTCLKHELCSLSNQHIAITAYIDGWNKCRHEDRNPYQVSPICAKETYGKPALEE
jgi:hypothetical protein